MEQICGQIRDGAEVFFNGVVYLASFEIEGAHSWCGMVLAPMGQIPFDRPRLTLHLGRRAIRAHPDRHRRRGRGSLGEGVLRRRPFECQGPGRAAIVGGVPLWLPA